MPRDGKKIYLTFDDGPHPEITPYVLNQLKEYDARATFFCIGKNVEAHPALYARILQEGHSVGNHTYSHINGWKTGGREYAADIARARTLIKSPLFRPPYGRIKRSQLKFLKQEGYRPVMWNILSGDFDKRLGPEDCKRNVIGSAETGAVIVFHDSEKAWPRLEQALPGVLKFFSANGYSFEGL
jgi:peptidoglycan/xylan/chitin deacetylase (PgdA/CDA1 family)